MSSIDTRKQDGSRGFTLLELSMVLVIIGLIVGSVMVGQELIRNAEVRATLKQIEQIETAVNNFRLKYNCLPGDCASATGLGFEPTLYSGLAPRFFQEPDNGFSLFSTAYAQEKGGDVVADEEIPTTDDDLSIGPNGNNDGQFADDEDAALFFDQLAQSGFFATSNSIYIYLPVSGGGTSGRAFWTVRTVSGKGNYLMPVSGTPFNYHTLTPSNAYGLDKKRDDGKPIVGLVEALTSAGATLTAGDKSSTACVSTSDAYNTFLATTVCGQRIKVAF